MYQPSGIPRHLVTGLAAVLLAAGLGACGQQSNDTTSAGNQGETAPAQADRTMPAVQRNLMTYDVCKRLPAADVAGILGATPEQTSAQATMLRYATDCTYTIELGEGAKDYAIIFIYSPEMWAPAMAGKIEKIEGLGDDAYLEMESLGSFKNVKVLVKGDFMLDARANTPEQARGLAELALERLGADGGG